MSYSTPAYPNDPVREFQEKVANQIRDKISDLIPDEILTNMIEKVLNEDILRMTSVETDRYGYKVTVKSPVAKMIEKLLEPIIKEKIDRFFEENKEKVSKLVAEVLDQELSAIMLKAISNQFSGEFDRFKMDLNNRFVQEGKTIIS